MSEQDLRELYDRVYAPDETDTDPDYGDEPWVTLADESIRHLIALLDVCDIARQAVQWADNITEWPTPPPLSAELRDLRDALGRLDDIRVT